MEFGRPEDGEDLAEFVLKQITDRSLFNKEIKNAANGAIDIIVNGVDHAMNKYN